MLHPINPPSCVNELLALVDLQKKTLEFAEANSTYSDVSFKAFVPSEFVDWLIALRGSTNKGSRKIANRFTQEITDYIKCSQTDKKQILIDFILDQEYFSRIEDSSFMFSLLPAKSIAHEKAKDLLKEFYELLGEGYPSVLVGLPLNTGLFLKSSVVSGYVKNNPDVEYVCPCCDSVFTDSANANEKGYTLEHYFPKSLYPSICLHPLNLIPMCSGCNSRKGDIDPLEPSVSPAIQVPYAEIFHPISRPVRTLATLDFKPTTTLIGDMEFFAQNPPPSYEQSIKAYKIMYQIPDRWNVNWTRVDNRVSRCVKRAQQRTISTGIDDQKFDLILLEAIAELEDSFGKDHFSYPAAKWLAWARTNKFQELKNSFLVS